MILKDISFPGARENISYDQTLLESAEQGASGEALRFWEAKKFFIVLGRISRPEEDIEAEKLCEDNIETIRRVSGGGTILQGPGCLNYSLVLSYERNPFLRNIRKSYEIILNKICDSLKKLRIEAMFEPISDIALYGRKFSGNAQSRKRKYMLHHGTLLYDFPIEMIGKYIKMPKNEPPYRKGRAHDDFLININAAPRDIKEAIRSSFCQRKDER
ncbi:MAG: lipoate--protein ligase family protein [Candidatus Omnitrophota bacterium]|nr:lipoate--protein ligase family protein [Candidatus Omnitrophota bacterium]